jgi:hypothetical protein
MSKVVCIGAQRQVNGVGSLSVVEGLSARLASELGVEPRVLTIDPLSVDWHSELDRDHFRSGCAPVEAMHRARALIASGEEVAVIIHGRDLLRTEYSSDERRQAMSIYPDGVPLTEAYDRLTGAFIAKNTIEKTQFLALRDALFENYWRTYQSANPAATRPDSRWFEAITPLFRGVDCANPVIDFEAKLLLVSDAAARDLLLSEREMVEVVAVGVGQLASDGPEAIAEILPYQHLKDAVCEIETATGLSLRQLQRRGELCLDLYTCYPVVPLACLLATQLVSHPDQLLEFIEHNPITLTGGMNLARGPWNNPALNGLVAMFETLSQQPQREQAYGLVHGNGGLGYRQGLVLMT